MRISDWSSDVCSSDLIESIGSSFKYWVMAEVVYPYPRQHWYGRIAIFEVDLDHRIGIPLSQLDGRNGGNAAWRSLSESWCYPCATTSSEVYPSELQSLMRISYAVFCLKKTTY